MDRPPADPAKLLASWADWEHGDSTPGRVMADLKTGGLRDILEQVPTDGAAALLASWMAWEKGEAAPPDVVTTLSSGGVRPLLEGLVSEQATAGS